MDLSLLMIVALIVLPTIAAFETHLYYDSYLASLRYGSGWWEKTFLYAVITGAGYGNATEGTRKRYEPRDVSLVSYVFLMLVVPAVLGRAGALFAASDPRGVTEIFKKAGDVLQDVASVRTTIGGLVTVVVTAFSASWMAANRGKALLTGAMQWLRSNMGVIIVVYTTMFLIDLVSRLIFTLSGSGHTAMTRSIEFWSRGVTCSALFYVAYLLSGWVWVRPVLLTATETSRWSTFEFMCNLIKDGLMFFMVFEIVLGGMFVFITKSPQCLSDFVSRVGLIMAAIVLLASLTIAAEHWNVTRFGYSSPTGRIIQVHVWIRDWLCIVVPMVAMIVWCALTIARNGEPRLPADRASMATLWVLPAVLLLVWPWFWYTGSRSVKSRGSGGGTGGTAGVQTDNEGRTSDHEEG